MNIPIDKDIPIPVRRKNFMYPWHEMEIGDSFYTESSKVFTLRSHAARLKPKKFIVREWNTGARVWRVK